MNLNLWVFSGLLAAFMIAAQYAYQKKFTLDVSPLRIAYYTNLFALPFTIVYALLRGNTIGKITPKIGLVIIASTVFNIITIYLVVKALEVEDISIVGPLKSMTPLVVSLIEPFFIATVSFNISLVFASVLAVSGTYILLSDGQYKLPITRITEKGPLYGLIGAIVIGGAVIADKIALTAIPLEVYPAILSITISITFTPIMIYNEDISAKEIAGEFRDFLPLGAIRGVLLISIFFTLANTSGTNTQIMVQVSNIFVAFIGAQAFDEEHIIIRIIGIVLIISSISLIVI